MKKNLLTLSLLFVAALAFAQSETKKVDGKNEIKLNLFGTILGMPEITYERLLKDDGALGISAFIGVDDDLEYKYGFMPYYRIYFGSKKANGFFIEANSALIGTKTYNYVYYGNYEYYAHVTSDLNFGLGAAAGAKFITKNGFIGEIYGGVGRIFNRNAVVEAYPRVGITIGKRF